MDVWIQPQIYFEDQVRINLSNVEAILGTLMDRQRSIDVVKLVKGIWWMPWRPEAMKDVAACDKLGEGGKQPVIPRSLNGATPCHLAMRWHDPDLNA